MNLQDIKEKIPLSEIVKTKIKLIKKNNLFWGRCVFHEEKTPSFVVNDEKKIYHCFGCGAHGDIFSFLMHINEETFANVLEQLCESHAIPYDKKLAHHHNNEQVLNEILLDAMALYKQSLIEHQQHYNYLISRNLNDKIIDLFQLGYGDQNKTVIKLLEKYSLDQLKEVGIVSVGSFDRLRNRIIFPLFNERNQVIAFAGRCVNDEKPKYINSSETPLFQKNLLLYNIHNIPSKVEEIFLVEGYMDAITMYMHGFDVVASMGTSVSKGQIFMIFRRTKKIFIVFDGDRAGQMAMDRTLKLILEMILPGYEVYLALLPIDMDPDNFLKKHSPEEFRHLFKNIIDFLSYKITENLNLQLAHDLTIGFSRLYEYIEIIKNKSVQMSYKITLENFLKQQQYNSKKNNIKKTPQITKNSPYTPSIEENIFIIILKYDKLFEEYVEQLARITFENTFIENVKNQMLLHMHKRDDFTHIIQATLATTYVKKILEANRSFLHREEFCRKYLWDLLCLMPII